MAALDEYREALRNLGVARAADWLPNPSPLHRRNLDRNIAAANGNVNLAAANVFEEAAEQMTQNGATAEKGEKLKNVAASLSEAAVDLYAAELPSRVPNPLPIRVRQRQEAIAVNRFRVEQLVTEGLEILGEE